MSADAVSPLTFAVGDIHGCLDKLDRVIAACEAHAGGRPARYVFVGDYIDRGPHSRDVVESLRRRQAARPGTIVCLRGNHEQMAIDAHASDRAMPLWLANNGASTLRNYGGGRMSDEHLAWLAALPFCHDDGLRFFVHAGVDLDAPLDRARPHPVANRQARSAPPPPQPRHRGGHGRPAHRRRVRRHAGAAAGVFDGWGRGAAVVGSWRGPFLAANAG